MRARLVAALYDVHGNLPGLEAVLADVERADADLVLVGGDIAAGPMPAETLDAVLALGERMVAIRGNADRAAAEGRQPGAQPEEWAERDAWIRAQLPNDHARFLGELPPTVTVEIAGLGSTLFCHGSPRSDEEILTRATPPERLRPILAGVTERVVVCGHTHVQFDRTVDGVRVVNAGSVGMPYEGRTGAYWALLGPDVELRRSEYDVHAAAERIRATTFPGADDYAREYVLASYSPDEATETFERMVEAS
ncbi:MAG: metallophosphoesterase family protein [Thermoleophilia bacterium]|nr:metallophosphoesterase family protein [Thermoleophilia bacterium]